MIRILHIDDDDEFLKLTEHFLLKLNSKLVIEPLSQPINAIKLLETHVYDVIVSDYQMPGITGIELLKEIRKSGNNIPFIIFTGHSREEVVIEALNHGADYYMQKGTDLEPLMTQLNHLIDESVKSTMQEKRLIESEERFRSAFTYAKIGMAITNLEGIISQVNNAYCELIGYSEKELIGLSFKTLTYHDDLEINIDLFRQLTDGELETYEYKKRYVHKNGKIFWVSMTASLIKDFRGKPKSVIALFQVQ